MITHLTWQNFRSGIIRQGENRAHRVCDSPLIDVFADANGKRIGLLIQTNDSKPLLEPSLSQLLMLEVEKTQSKGQPVLQVTCANSRFFREAYLLFTAVVDRVLSDGIDAVQSLQEELSDLRALMGSGAALSMERQIGLFGELLVLEAFVKTGGLEMITCWTGPLGENHDFRFSGHEFEVKTTTGRRRIHTVNGLSQATPSVNCDLTFISVLLAAAGSGEGHTLPELVQNLKELFNAKGSSLAALKTAIEKCGFRAEESSAYTRRWKLRQEMALVPVDAAFPAITASTLESAMGTSFSRLENVCYEVNLDTISTRTGGDLSATLRAIMQSRKSQ